MSQRHQQLARAVSLGGDKRTITDFYDEWAGSYDSDVVETIGYVGHLITADALAARVRDDAQVLDVGCGTGLIAVELKKRKHSLRIDGIDLTRSMLNEAVGRNVYRHLTLGDLTGKLDFPDDCYDGIVSSGVFTTGHVGPSGLDELIRIARPGAPIVLAVRDTAWEGEGFKAYIEELEAGGKIVIREVRLSTYLGNEGVFCQLCVLEVI